MQAPALVFQPLTQTLLVIMPPPIPLEVLILRPVLTVA
jgi:hypothetical protein